MYDYITNYEAAKASLLAGNPDTDLIDEVSREIRNVTQTEWITLGIDSLQFLSAQISLFQTLLTAPPALHNEILDALRLTHDELVARLEVYRVRDTTNEYILTQSFNLIEECNDINLTAGIGNPSGSLSGIDTAFDTLITTATTLNGTGQIDVELTTLLVTAKQYNNRLDYYSISTSYWVQHVAILTALSTMHIYARKDFATHQDKEFKTMRINWANEALRSL